MIEQWLDSPPLDDCRDVVEAARATGVLDTDERSVVFHDLDRLDARLDELTAAFPAGTLHSLAIKANPLVEVLRNAVARGAGLEAASIEEVHLALAAGCLPDRIVFDSPAKTHAEITEALALGIRLNVDNLDELERVLGDARAAESSSIVGVRINPLVAEGSIGITSVGGGRSRFGLPADVAIERLPEMFASSPSLRGLHVHVGSQGTNLRQLVDGAAQAERVRRAIDDHCGAGAVSVVDIGGGLPARYTTEEPPTPDRYARALAEQVPGLLDGGVQLVTEFGRAIQANCGWALSRVEYVKTTSAGPVAVIHLGADFLMRPAYQPENWRHRFSRLGPGSPLSGESGAWTVAGPLCFAGDVVGREVDLPALAPGDEVVVHDVGAYTLSMWSRHCSRGMPLVLGYRRGPDIDFTVLRRAERPADIVRFWSAE